MVIKIGAIQRIHLTFRDYRNVTEGSKKKPQTKARFKEVLTKQLAAKPPITRK